jgi:protein-S-isoprenylcysteine O-methyltransferase Ste14
MWFIVAGGVVPAMLFLPDRLLYPRPVVFLVTLILAGLYWLYFLVGAANVNRQVARSAAGIDRVVTTGVYSLVRHPIYAADIILAWAIFLYIPSIRVIVSVVWLTIVLVSWMKLEEKALQQKFGQEYASYKAVTPMIIPNFLKMRIFKR